MSADDLLLVGRVARPHGIRGQVIVNPETDFPGDRFRQGQPLLIGSADHAVERRIDAVRFHQGRPILALAGIETIDEAERLAGAEVWVRQEALEPGRDSARLSDQILNLVGRENTAVQATLGLPARSGRGRPGRASTRNCRFTGSGPGFVAGDGGPGAGRNHG